MKKRIGKPEPRMDILAGRDIMRKIILRKVEAV